MFQPMFKAVAKVKKEHYEAQTIFYSRKSAENYVGEHFNKKGMPTANIQIQKANLKDIYNRFRWQYQYNKLGSLRYIKEFLIWQLIE